MNAKGTIRKILFVSLWLIIGSGMVILLAAAMRKQKNARCRDYSIVIKSEQGSSFINEKDVQQMLATTNSLIKGQPISSFNLNGMEQLLEKNEWVEDAELYFDNKDVLHIVVTEREPLARIFTTAGNSFYIDGAAKKISLSDRMSARVPVFTSFPEKKKLSNSDSLLLNDVRSMAQFISNDPFWMAQVAQIDITPERNFEMIPVVGNHVIRLGNGENLDQKFHRLFVFYKEILSKTGFDKYRVIDVQYAGQVVASKQPGNAKVDMQQLRKNVDKLLKEATETQKDTVAFIKEDQQAILKYDSTNPTNLRANDQGAIKTSDPNVMKTISVSPVSEKAKSKTVEENRKPKAVMAKKETTKEEEY